MDSVELGLMIKRRRGSMLIWWVAQCTKNLELAVECCWSRTDFGGAGRAEIGTGKRGTCGTSRVMYFYVLLPRSTPLIVPLHQYSSLLKNDYSRVARLM